MDSKASSGGLPAKLARPRLPAVHLRTRLFGLLDQSFSAPVVWVEGAPGSGKTTLAASWLDAGKHPCIWYQLDAGDADVATFFHYLGIAVGQAAPRYRQPLPHLTPEYAAGIETFTRRFFLEFFHRLPKGAVVVFDNVQEAGAEGAFHEVLRLAFETVPEHVRVLCLSRSRPPAAFTRLRVNRNLACLGPEVMRLSTEEAQAFACLYGVGDGPAVSAIHQQTHGWAAGLVLMLDHRAGTLVAPEGDAAPQALFDYFMGEILLRLEESTRQFLLKSALLPTMRAADAEALADSSDGGAILAGLVQRNYFTYRLSPQEPVYEYHPLFRAFLLKRLEEIGAPEERRRQKSAAAHLLETSGEVESAAELYCDAGDWTSLATLVRRHAERLISEGRSQALERWLCTLPEEIRDADGWLRYWLGNCRLAYNPSQARMHFEQAYILFSHADDVVGMYLAWAGVIDTFMYEWDDFAQIDPWVGELERLRERYPRYPSPEIEARVTMGMLAALTWRFAGHPALPEWADRAMGITVASAGSRLAMMIGNHLVFYSLWDGEFPRAAAIVETLRPHAARLRHDPLALLHWYVMDGMYSWFVADHAACLAAVEAGNRLAEETGIHLLDIYINAQGVYSGVSMNDPVTARECMRRMIEAAPVRMLDKSLCSYMLASVAWLEGDYPRAIQHGEAAVHLARATNSPLAIGLCTIELAKTLLEVRRVAEANACLKQGSQSNHGRKFMEYLEDLHCACIALAQGDEATSLERLRHAMSLGAKQGYVNIPRWRPTVMARLCAMSLEHDIETDYARMLITRRALSPPEDMACNESWPWPVRIHALGRFVVEVNGVPLAFGHKAQRRPLELLKALLAQGSQGVATEHLAEMLWPDAEGDAAHRSLITTVHRLRRLLGEQALLTHEGRVSLSRQHCWVDVWALEQRLGAGEAALKEGIEKESGLAGGWLEPIFALYRGPFLDGEACGGWALGLRERLHGRLLRFIERLGAWQEKAGAWDAAADSYRKGIEIDPLTELFYRRLMGAYRALGRPAEALATFERCREALHTTFGIAPATETQSLYQAILAEAQRHV